jgi:hypothetical protein
LEALDSIAERAPRLRYLALRSHDWDGGELGRLLRHPLVERLSVLDLFAVHCDVDFDALLAGRERLAHLDALILGSHRVPEAVPARFSDWPQVRFASWDRAELADFDRDWAERGR